MLHPQNYLSNSVIKFLSTPPHGMSSNKLIVFCEYLVRIGLRWPSEKTSQMASAVFICITGVDSDAMDDSAKYQLLQNFKKTLRETGRRIPGDPNATVVWEFPFDPDGLGESWTKTMFGESHDEALVPP